MKRWNNRPVCRVTVPMVTAQQPPLPQRVPQQFVQAMKRLSSDQSSEIPPKAPAQRPGQSSAVKWKSSFKPIDGEEEETSEDKGTANTERSYDPYSPSTSDTEANNLNCQDRNCFPPNQETSFERQRLSPGRGCPIRRRWDMPFPREGSRPTEEQEFMAGSRPAESRGPDPDSISHLGYSSMGGAIDQRGCSPDRHVHGGPPQRYSPPYGGQHTSEEETLPLPEYRREQIATTVRLSPPRIPRDYKPPPPYAEMKLDQDPPPENVIRNRSKNVVMDKYAATTEEQNLALGVISCDLCDVELGNGQELNEHLDSGSHWDMLEHVQQNNNYDDTEIAFLQDVLLFKSHQCSGAIEDGALQSLQENDHMTKVEVFRCAACKVFVYTSAAEVHRHINSREHLVNTEDFQLHQRRSSLCKAKTMMEKLQPQLERFLEGRSPFE